MALLYPSRSMAECLNLLTHHVHCGSRRLMRPQVKPIPRRAPSEHNQNQCYGRSCCFPSDIDALLLLGDRAQSSVGRRASRRQTLFPAFPAAGQPCGQVWAVRPQCDCIFQVCPLQRKGKLSAPSFLVSLHSDWVMW